MTSNGEPTAAHQHADLDALADVLAADSDGGAVPADISADVAGCSTCSAALADLRTALAAVATDLAQLPDVPPVPASLAQARLAPVPAPTTVLPGAGVASLEGRRRRWLLPAGGAAAAAALVVGGGLLLTHGKTDSSSPSRTAAGAASLAVSHTGARYSKTSLAAAVPGLLTAKPESSVGGPKAPAPQSGAVVNGATSDALATLQTPKGLAACLAGLTGPGQEDLPLALDYATFEGKPALVVVLPSSRPSKLDVFVVGATCNQTEQDVLYYLHADRPAG